MGIYKNQRGDSTSYLLIALAIFLLVVLPYGQAEDDRQNVKALKDDYQAFVVLGEAERLRGREFNVTFDGVYEVEGQLGAREYSLTYEFKDGIATKTLETSAVKLTGKAAFVQNGHDVAYSLVEGDGDLFPSTPEVFVATPDGKVYSAFAKASLERIPATQVAADKAQAQTYWEWFVRFSMALIAVAVLYIVLVFSLGMLRGAHRRH